MPTSRSIVLCVLGATASHLATTVDAAPRRERAVGTWRTGLTWGSKAYLFGSDIRNVDVVEVDTHYSSESEIQTYRSRGQRVVCYFSAGTLEEKRTDKWMVSKEALSTKSPYRGEQWFNIMNWEKLKPLMNSRLDLAQAKNCDAVEADNIDCFQYSGCCPSEDFGTKQQATLEYVTWLANSAHQRGMAFGLKNAFEIIEDVVDLVDFAINESCPTYNQCDVYESFKARGKAVFAAEYKKSGNSACDTANEYGISMLYKSGGGYANCWGKEKKKSAN